MDNILDSDIIVSEFEHESCSHVYLRANTVGKLMKSVIAPAIGCIVPQLLFSKDNTYTNLTEKTTTNIITINIINNNQLDKYRSLIEKN